MNISDDQKIQIREEIIILNNISFHLPYCATLLVKVAELHYSLCEYSLAVTVLLRAVSINTENPHAYFMLGKIYTNLGYQEVGLSYFRQAIELDQLYSIDSDALEKKGRFFF